MARTSDPNSATAQFFINVKDNANLDAPNPDGHGYAVFGKVVSGTEVIDKIRAVRTGNKAGMQDVPLDAVTIQSATVIQ
jgi:peptidyl-prolyl cis-trans isomerase A (cyclophilin A)